ncbi:DUF4040 domain-containing protein [Nocardioidaceae bacterium]|nr:DUF4040 domain-containing protein [Nocardioidaceae bacterium]
MSLLLLAASAAVLVALTPVVVRAFGVRAGWVLAAALAGLTLWLVAVWLRTPDVVQSVPWIPSIEVSLRLRLDGLGLLFGVLVLGIGSLVMLYSTAYVSATGSTAFYSLMVLFAAAMLVLVLADDLVVMFVAWELTTLCSYLLILRSSPEAGPPASRTLLVTAGGGLSLLGAVALIVVTTGTTTLTEALAHDAWREDPVFAATAGTLVAVAAFTKSAQFPFHAWLPDAMVAPAPVSAYLHAAAMVKAGIYLLLRFADAAAQSPVWAPLLVTVGVTTTLMGAVFALQRSDIKELMAYSTVSQLGLLVAIIGVGGDYALLAACLHVVAHALFKAAGFMYVGLVERRTGTRDIRELHGLGRAMPWTTALVAVAMASMAGVPPLLGFISKELVLSAGIDAVEAGAGVVAVLAVVGVALAAVVTVAYSARVVVDSVRGAPMQVEPVGGTVSMAVAMGLCAGAGLVLGAGVPALDWLIRPAAAAAAGVAPSQVEDLKLWYGVNLALMTSVAVIAAGVLLVVLRRRIEPLLDRPLFPGSGVAAVERLRALVVDAGARVGDLTRTDSPAAHLAVPIALVASLGVVAFFVAGPGSLSPAPSEPLDALLLALLVVGCGATIASRTRLGAVAAIGIIGFVVALWFFVLGAADVALTQLLVEILLVLVIVLVLRRMPPRFARRSGRHRLGSGLLAVAAGVAATVATLGLTGGRDIAPAGEFYLREAETLTGGTNIVNTILVDFRALDTFGELVVLAVAGMAMTALLSARGMVDRRPPVIEHTALDDSAQNVVFLRVLARGVVPLMVLGSAFALYRGHDAPGGGFISALIGAAAVGLVYLSAPSDRWTSRRLPFLAIAGVGVLLSAAVGLLGLVDGSYLRPIDLDPLGFSLSSALVFDLGVYLAVFGVILAAVSLLGGEDPEDPQDSQDPGDGRLPEDARAAR